MNFKESPIRAMQNNKLHLSEELFNPYEQTEGKEKLQADFNNLRDNISDLAVEASNEGDEELYNVYQELLSVMNTYNKPITEEAKVCEDAGEDFLNNIIEKEGPKL